MACPSLKVPLPPPFVQCLLRRLVVPCCKYNSMPAAVSSSSNSQNSWSLDLNDPVQREIQANNVRDSASRFPEMGLGWDGPMRWGLAGAFSKLYQDIESDMKDVEYPFLLMHAPEDQVCSF